jgi:branched-chain amino acid transport system substrate-binding protein
MSAMRAGEAIRRGMILAVEELNRSGGVLGRPLELVVRDNRGNPARGIDNIEELARMDDLVAVVGGSFTPVALAEIETIHRHGLIYLGPWAAGTAIVDNGQRPNFVFRVSVRDEFAGGFLVNAALDRGFRNLGLLLWRTAWGRSNETAMTEALDRLAMEPAGIQWFNSGQQDMSAEIDALIASGADAIMLVSGVADGEVAIREIASRVDAERLPIISHWGITTGDMNHNAGAVLGEVDLTFLQTFSFADPPFPNRADRVYRAYCERFGDCTSPGRVPSAVGTAHAYDLIHLLHMAIDQAGSVDRDQVRRSLEALGPYQGLLRDYEPPFTPDRHDALDATDFRLSRYGRDGAIIPLPAR